jgi:hypothetical protein
VKKRNGVTHTDDDSKRNAKHISCYTK